MPVCCWVRVALLSPLLTLRCLCRRPPFPNPASAAQSAPVASTSSTAAVSHSPLPASLRASALAPLASILAESLSVGRPSVTHWDTARAAAGVLAVLAGHAGSAEMLARNYCGLRLVALALAEVRVRRVNLPPSLPLPGQVPLLVIMHHRMGYTKGERDTIKVQTCGLLVKLQNKESTRAPGSMCTRFVLPRSPSQDRDLPSLRLLCASVRAFAASAPAPSISRAFVAAGITAPLTAALRARTADAAARGHLVAALRAIVEGSEDGCEAASDARGRPSPIA